MFFFDLSSKLNGSTAERAGLAKTFTGLPQGNSTGITGKTGHRFRTFQLNWFNHFTSLSVEKDFDPALPRPADRAAPEPFHRHPVSGTVEVIDGTAAGIRPKIANHLLTRTGPTDFGGKPMRQADHAGHVLLTGIGNVQRHLLQAFGAALDTLRGHGNTGPVKQHQKYKNNFLHTPPSSLCFFSK
ncbi:hypothetical protein [Labrenzia sp. 011]|uniref:hypothetical protein n=1 Tax=Labrenzia sp. 011 TaxID=2171494 RepID=UPI0010575258|nr:hypothetical protein [Labrenzia sp. 011]